MTKWSELSPRERDALVAEKVMGQTPEVREKWRGGCLCGRDERCSVCSWPLPYSTDIAAAWEVLFKLIQLMSNGVSLSYSGEEWTVHKSWTTDAEPMGWAKLAPEAICLAALRACGVNV